MKAIRSSRVVTPDGVRAATLFVHDGRIERVAAHDEAPPDTFDYGDLVVMPGLVDSHVHVNEPGRTEWEGFATATRAAAAGGVTTIVDMPLNSVPVTTSVEALHAKLASMEGKLHVDVALWGGAVPGNLAELRPLVVAGVVGFKAFMIDSGIPEFPPLDAAGLERAARELRKAGVPLLLHAELPGPIETARPGAARFAATAHRRWLASRPREAEDEAVALAAEICARSRAAIHIVHLSSATAVPIVARARKRGLPFTAETTPHYLHFAAEEVRDGATEFKCAPPIRERENRERLWSALRDGTIDLVVSDHSPCAPELKCRDRGDFDAAWGGIASLQFTLAVTWTEARARGHGLAELTRWMCAAPARLAGLDRRKGAIAPGFDADLVVWDPDAPLRVDSEAIEHRHKLTPYLGAALTGLVHETWLRGRRIHAEGRFEPPSGEWISRNR